MALTARRGETRLIAILLGAVNEDERDNNGEALLNWGFENFKTLRPGIGLLPTVRIWKSKEKYGSLKLSKDPMFTVSARRAGVLLIETELVPILEAPLAAGDRCGVLIISDEIGELRRIPLVLEKEAGRGNFFRVLFDSIRLFFKKHFS
jgi:D-alanyl-D-alanine carboxypeptidase (penicillin-binding protein 5/6)